MLPPFELEHVWRWFCDLAAARTNNGFSANPITFAEIAAWAALTGAQPTPWEVSVLRRLDRDAVARMAAKAGKGTNVAANDSSGVLAMFRRNARPR